MFLLNLFFEESKKLRFQKKRVETGKAKKQEKELVSLNSVYVLVETSLYPQMKTTLLPSLASSSSSSSSKSSSSRTYHQCSCALVVLYCFSPRKRTSSSLSQTTIKRRQPTPPPPLLCLLLFVFDGAIKRGEGVKTTVVVAVAQQQYARER